MRFYIFITLSLISIGSVLAQENKVLSIDECIQIALDNNLTLRQAQNNSLMTRAAQMQAMMGHLPSISANANYDYFIGTTFDQNAARQVTATTNSSNPNVQGRLTLFNGLSVHNTRKQRVQEYLAAQSSVENAKLTTEANILQAYLNTLLGEENIRISIERVDLLQAQLDRAIKRESVGVGNMEQVYNFKSQLATEKLNLQTLKNTYQQSLLTLLQAMRLEPANANYTLEPVGDTDYELLTTIDPFEQVLEECMSVNPALASAKASFEASKYQFRSAWGQQMPSITVFGMLGSNYSSNGATNPDKPFNDPETGEGFFNFEPDATFLQQMGYNQFEYVNFSISIPIFSQLRGNSQIQTAKLSMDNAKLDSEIAVQDITNAVQRMYLDLVAAQVTYESAQENLEALQQTFEFMKKRYETGNTDFYTYLESLNNKNRAETQLVNAKYSIVLRKKVLDVYRML